MLYEYELFFNISMSFLNSKACSQIIFVGKRFTTIYD